MNKQTRKAHWSPQDIILSRLFFVGMIVLLGASAINLKVLIVGSGNPEYLGSGVWKAWVLSLTCPLIGVGLKILPSAFKFPETRRTYIKCLYGTTVLIAFIWLVLLASYFNPDIDITDLLQGGNDKRPLILAQLLLEVCLGASFFTAWAAIEERYCPKPPSLDAQALDKQIRDLEPRLSAARERVSNAAKKAEQLKTARTVFVNKQLEHLVLLKAKRSNDEKFFGV